MDRLSDIRGFYGALYDLKKRVGGFRTLAACDGRMDWPRRGVYFFFEEGEVRSDSGSGLRVVRVGTHALKGGSRTTLWKRLRNHKGTKSGHGNHRGSIFRKLVGSALARRESDLRCETWEDNTRPLGSVKASEHKLECAVSEYIGAMPFLWLEVDDKPSPGSLRGFIERNSIALLSNYDVSRSDAIDPSSRKWLGKRSDREKVRQSGLWNSNHVDAEYDPSFLSKLAKLVSQM